MIKNNHLQDARIVAVYNANGGIIGELSYVIKKVLGKTHCALCDISHGNSIKAKAQWRERPSPYEQYISTKWTRQLSKPVMDTALLWFI